MKKPVTQLSEEELLERLESLLMACHVNTTERPKTKLLRVPGSLIGAFSETYKEVESRGLKEKIKVPKIISESDPAPVFHKNLLIRYLEEPYLVLFASGMISLRFAKGFKDDPNAARKDDELMREYHGPDGDVNIGGEIYKATNFKIQHHIRDISGREIPYHLVSFSSEESRKLARAFNTAGYVVIQDFKKFYNLFSDALHLKFPKADVRFEDVEYFDPLENKSAQLIGELIHRKSFHFQYQNEARISVVNSGVIEERLNIQIDPPLGMMKIVKL